MKKYMNCALIYAILGMVGGVFYRTLTKSYGFTGRTTLGFVHTHYFMLGMFFFLVLALLGKTLDFSNMKMKRILIFYHIGLNMTVIMLIVRGIFQVVGTEMSAGMDASIAGIAGIGHIILGISMVILLFKLKKICAE